jgi:hypothetical protein
MLACSTPGGSGGSRPHCGTARGGGGVPGARHPDDLGKRLGADDLGRFEFMSDTAWSTLDPIFEALAERPEASSLTITIHAFDEGWNFAFIGSIRGGHYLGQAVEAIDALYQGVYQRVDEVVVA